MIELFDAQMRFVRPIDTALRCGYKQVLSGLPSADLVMAADDPVNEQILVPASFLRLTDGDEPAGLYRFKNIDPQQTGEGGTVTYRLEGAQATLLDDMLIGWHELGGTGLDTKWVLEYILSRQTERRWNLGQCDFSDYYQYNFEDVSLLEAIMSLGEVLTVPHRFVFEADGPPPWTLHLIRLQDVPSCALASGRNLPGITRRVDGRIVTRLVGRGYGEGDNQLTIASVNGGRDYLDADTIGTWGVRVGVHADRRQTDPATLMARMAAILESGKNPRESYEGSVIDFSRATGERWDLHRVGDQVLILDGGLERTVQARITEREKKDIEGDPGSVVLTLDNSVRDTADELNEVLDKIGVQELYSQGATNLYSMQISDSADESHPLTMRFYVPGNVLRINSCLLSWKLERFRSYATLAASGGASTRTSSQGGGATVTLPARTVSVGLTYSGQPMDAEGSDAGLTGGPKNFLGEALVRTGSAPNHSHSMVHVHAMSGHTHRVNAHSHSMVHVHALSGHTHGTVAHNHNYTHVHALSGHSHSFSGNSGTYSIGHNHSLAGEGASTTGAIYSGNKSIRVTPSGTVESSGTLWTTSGYASSGGSSSNATSSASPNTLSSGTLWTATAYDAVEGNTAPSTGESSPDTSSSGTLWTTGAYDAFEGASMAATGENGAHTHEYNHVHDMPHVHNIAHEHTIPAMEFTLSAHSHTVNLPDHTHNLTPGIYEGSMARNIRLLVDGEAVPESALEASGNEIDVSAWLRKTQEGRIVRSSWHEVEFVPDALTRITANLFFQVFIQSRGAGDY